MVSKIATILVTIGALNWGLVGLGWLFGGADWNVVHMIFGSMMKLEAVIYILVGVSGIARLCCHCKKCMAACASCTCNADAKMGGGAMGGNM